VSSEQDNPSAVHLRAVLQMFDTLGPQLGQAVHTYLDSQPDADGMEELVGRLAEFRRELFDLQDMVERRIAAQPDIIREGL
jgi:hypothetical protein